MRQIEINLIFAADAVAFETNLEDLARRNVARNEIAVSRIFFFEEIPAFVVRNVFRIARVAVDFAEPKRGRLRRAPIRTLDEVCLRPESRSDEPE